MRGRDALRFFAQVRADGNFDRAVTLAERLALDLSRPVTLMSTGMRQKAALAAVLSGRNFGKMLVRVGKDPTR